jgi:16S rRNA processing protein RimM
MDNKLATGIIGTAFGLKGQVKVYPYSDDREHFLSLSEVVIEKGGVKKNMEIEECKLANGCVLVHFKGFDTPEAAKSLAGFVVWVNREEAAPLREGEVYTADLAGLAVVHDGNQVGKVVSCTEGIQGLLLEIKTESETHFIPYIGRYFGKTDLEAGTLELKEMMLLS